MERLTYEIHDGGLFVKESDIKTFDIEDEVMHTGNAIWRLAEYENLEEQGKLLKLPCKVGNSIYIILHNHTIRKSTVIGYRLVAGGWIAETEDWNYSFDEFGKTVFLTKESALQKMNETEG